MPTSQKHYFKKENIIEALQTLMLDKLENGGFRWLHFC
jgi:hypothetical protein